MCVYVKPTYGDIRGAVCLQEAVEVLPGLGYPVDDLNQVIAAHVLIDLRLYQLSPQEPAQETFDWFSVIRAQHPPGAKDSPVLTLLLKFKMKLNRIILAFWSRVVIE